MLYMQSTPNEFELANRRRKARRIADFLWLHIGADSPTALPAEVIANGMARWTERDWQRVADLTGEDIASRDTRQIIVSLIRRRPQLDAAKAAANADPFAGLPS